MIYFLMDFKQPSNVRNACSENYPNSATFLLRNLSDFKPMSCTNAVTFEFKGIKLYQTYKSRQNISS